MAVVAGLAQTGPGRARRLSTFVESCGAAYDVWPGPPTAHRSTRGGNVRSAGACATRPSGPVSRPAHARAPHLTVPPAPPHTLGPTARLRILTPRVRSRRPTAHPPGARPLPPPV